MKNFLLALLPLFAAQVLIAQDVFRFGAIPVVNLNLKLNKNYSLNGKLENRHIFEDGTFNGEIRNADYRFERQDAEVVLANKLSANAKAAGGYMIRFESERVIHRTMQQVSFTQPLGTIRFAHRIKADQTWDPNEPFELRLRYRLGAEIPLFGTQVDPRELYLKTNLEYLARFQEGYETEFRALPALGYLAANQNAFELGLDYRFSNAFENVSGHGFWIYFGYYLRFDRSKNEK